ncbi:hypothetical protein Cob_v005456 [Colletotrichum orbiculare MAFF 240422]|uniref:Uncharacterized protein n=1 Tax=Colletotrichum orbiculare (strain 104-T / ATCC 96160 / CBS 514.97 / LARS 414 / MAFF 240422) TaxID=1213857 RepID=N4V8V2_COLOR|nr:hypothetical protein Cob_v005456 [Colletotrichum orbiculare MAFF 240422]
MDNTPLHPDIVTLPQDGSGHRHGDFLTAIPYNRSMYRTTLILRIASVLLAVTILGALASQRIQDTTFVSNWCFGSPTAILGLTWSLLDLMALCVRDKGVRWTKDTTRRQRSTRFSWGPPGAHVAGHLIIWAATAALMGFLISQWIIFQTGGPYELFDKRQAQTMAALIFFMFWLMTIHFSLFIFASVEVDNIRRQYSDVVFVPRGALCEMVPVPPTTPTEIFVPRRMTLSFFANHYVRFVPGANGTVTVARDYSSRQARF